VAPSNAAPRPIGRLCREPIQSGNNPLPFFARDFRNRGQMAAAIVTALAARPVSVNRGDLLRTLPYRLLNLI